MSELKRCPFCGGDKLKIESKTKDISYRYVRQHTLSVRCNKCHARGGTVSGEIGNYSFGTPKSEKLTTLKELEEKAIEAWNTRKPMERIVERLEKEKVFEDSWGDDMGCGAYNAYHHAIEIVKAGGAWTT